MHAYDPHQVLASLDAHRWQVIGLCAIAMICNYAWFIAAVRQGLRERIPPLPIFCTLFWLVGDGSMVLRYDLWFNVYDHWYLKLFWGALVLTVICELVFLTLYLRFGRAESMPGWSQGQFVAFTAAAFVMAAVVWSFVKARIDDPLYIDYFHLANIAGPIFSAGQILRRKSRAGTTPFIWGAYTVMVACWFVACALWFGPPFATAPYIVFYAACTAAALGMTLWVKSLPPSRPATA